MEKEDDIKEVSSTEVEPSIENKEEANDEELQVKNKDLLKSPEILEEIRNIREEVRATEKAKMYKSLEREREKIKERDKKIKELNDKLSELSETVEQLESEKLSEKEKLERLKQKKDKATMKKIEELTANIEALNQAVHESELKAYRLEKLNKAEGKLVPELVGGNSKEEIDESIDKAKMAYESIRKEVLLEEKRGSTNSNIESVSPGPEKTFGVISRTERVEIPEFTAEAIKNMSPEEYEKSRSEIWKVIGAKPPKRSFGLK